MIIGSLKRDLVGADILLVGILSDSHGYFRMVSRALALFDSLVVEHIIHCGDVGDERVFDEFVGRSLTFVWGNTDFPSPALLAYLRGVNIEPPSGVPARVELEGKRFAVFHGHEAGFGRALMSPDSDYILHGHTHVRRNERFGRCRVINPGALHRARPKTVATLDTVTDALRFHEITG